jgi:glycosidase
MAMLLLMALRGNVFLYQGEELGLPQAEVPFDRLVDPEAIANWPETLGRDGARTPMPWRADAPYAGFSTAEPWLPVDPRHPPLAVDHQHTDSASMLNLTRRLIALRRREPALRLGALRFLDAPVPLLAFDRRGYRLGYGGGYYDRTLAALPGAVALGIGYAAQELDEVPAGPEDAPLAAIATEAGLVIAES